MSHTHIYVYRVPWHYLQIFPGSYGVSTTTWSIMMVNLFDPFITSDTIEIEPKYARNPPTLRFEIYGWPQGKLQFLHLTMRHISGDALFASMKIDSVNFVSYLKSVSMYSLTNKMSTNPQRQIKARRFVQTPSLYLRWVPNVVFFAQILSGCAYANYTDDSINSLWPSDAMWRHRSASTLAQVMACCLITPSHYLTHYLDVSSVRSRDIHLGAISQEMHQPSTTKISLKITNLEFQLNFQRSMS